MGFGSIMNWVKGLALVLALLISFNLGKNSVKLDVAESQIEETTNNEKAYDNVYSMSNADVLSGLRQYERD